MRLQKFLKIHLLTALALYLTTYFIPGFTIAGGVKNYFLTSLVLSLLNLFIRPLLKLLLLPLNLITLGAFRWLINIVILYLLAIIMPSVDISGYNLAQITYLGSFLPRLFLGQFFATLSISVFFSFIQHSLLWLVK